MSRTVNILVVILAILFVFILGLVHIVGIIDTMSEAPAEWKDFFVLKGKRYYNSYNIIDTSYAERVIGSVEHKVPRSADASTYVTKEGEAAYLDVGTKIYSVSGFDSAGYAAVIDDGDCYLYCTEDASPKDVVEKCGVRTLRRSVRFTSFSVGTVCNENSEYGVRISVIKNPSEMTKYLSRYVNDFRSESGAFTYDTLLKDRVYDAKYFEDGVLFAVRLPQDDGRNFFDLASITTDEVKMTFLLRQTTLPEGVSYDGAFVSHMFVELSREDYDDQKIAYQLERFELSPDGELLKADGAAEAAADNDKDEEKDGEAPTVTVRVFENAAAAVGTPYEELVVNAYDREFFDENDLVVVCVDDDAHGFDYALSGTERVSGVLKIAIDRALRSEMNDTRIAFFTLALPKKDRRGEIILPVINDPIPRDGMERRELRDVCVVRGAARLEELAEIYGFSTSLYDEDYFDAHVLLFAGDAVCSDGIDLSFVSAKKTPGGVELTVEETLPAECDFSPAYKYVAVPYLSGDLADGELSVRLRTTVEKPDKRDGGIFDRFFDD